MTENNEMNRPEFATVGALLLARNVLGNADLKRVLIFDENDSETVTLNDIVFGKDFEFSVLTDPNDEDTAYSVFAVKVKVEWTVPQSVLIHSVDLETGDWTLELEVEFTPDSQWEVNLTREFLKLLDTKGIRPFDPEFDND